MVTGGINVAQASGATALNVLASAASVRLSSGSLDRVAALRLPAIYQWPENAAEGGFAAYGPAVQGNRPRIRPTARQGLPWH